MTFQKENHYILESETEEGVVHVGGNHYELDKDHDFYLDINAQNQTWTLHTENYHGRVPVKGRIVLTTCFEFNFYQVILQDDGPFKDVRVSCLNGNNIEINKKYIDSCKRKILSLGISEAELAYAHLPKGQDVPTLVGFYPAKLF